MGPALQCFQGFTVSHLKLLTHIGNDVLLYLHAHSQTPFYSRLGKTWTATCYLRRRFGVIHVTDVSFGESKLATPYLNCCNVWVKPVSFGARPGRAGSVENESCTWQLSFGLHLPKNETQTLSAAPEPGPPSQSSNIQDWVILFNKQNITSNYSRPAFYSLLPRVGFITVCKCQDTYKTHTINDIFQIMLTCLGSHERRLNVTWCLALPRDTHLTGVGFPSGIS